MRQIKVLGSGCTKFIKTAELIGKVATGYSVAVSISKETDSQTLLDYGVRGTRAILIDEELIYSGSMPHAAQIKEWLALA
ncbi:MAG: hypothetical protein ACI93R_003215 [Flavobacteriales bacterium]|jgi:hypothetical protein